MEDDCFDLEFFTNLRKVLTNSEGVDQHTRIKIGVAIPLN